MDEDNAYRLFMSQCIEETTTIFSGARKLIF